METLNHTSVAVMQPTQRVEDEYSVNIPIRFEREDSWNLLSMFGLRKKKVGWISAMPLRGTLVMGTPGSEITPSVMKNFVRQHIEKGFAMYLLDSGTAPLTEQCYAEYVKNTPVYKKMYGVLPQFIAINFDDPLRSHRVNPLAPELLSSLADAREAALTILLNLNRTWASKLCDPFVNAAINYFQAAIWYMKKCQDTTHDPEKLALIRFELGLSVGQDLNVCTLPHVIELLSRDYEEILPLMMAQEDWETDTTFIAGLLEANAREELSAVVASLQISLSSLREKNSYWALTGNDFPLDINNKEAPKIFCLSAPLDRQVTYAPALALINGQLIKAINKRGGIKCSLIVDELSTIYFRELGTLLATARGNKISTTLGIQDYSRLVTDYGKEFGPVIFSMIGNVISGQVVGETASKVASQLDGLVTASQMGALRPGEMAGRSANSSAGDTKTAVFHGQLIEKFEPSQDRKPLPIRPHWTGLNDESMDAMRRANLERVKREVDYIIRSESTRLS